MWNRILKLLFIVSIAIMLTPIKIFAENEIIDDNYNYTIKGKKLYLVSGYRQNNGEILPVNRAYINVNDVCSVLMDSGIQKLSSCFYEGNSIKLTYHLNPEDAEGFAKAYMIIKVLFNENSPEVKTELYFNGKFIGGAGNQISSTETTGNEYNKKEVNSMISYNNLKLIPIRFLTESLFYTIKFSTNTIEIVPYNSIIRFSGPGYTLVNCSTEVIKTGWSWEFGWNELHTCKGKDGKRYYGY